MTLQWQREKEAANREIFQDAEFKTKQDFLEFLEVLPEALLESAVDRFVQCNSDITEFEQTISVVFNQAEAALSRFSNGTSMLMTLACAIALGNNEPSLDTWKKVRSLKRNSWGIDSGIAEAMLAYADLYRDAVPVYVELSNKVFEALENKTLKSLSERKNQEREGAWTYWSENQDKLTEIWWGLRGWPDFNYEEEFPLFRVHSELSPNNFIDLISQSRNPHLINSALLVACVGTPRFEQWEKYASDVPVAFKADGEWNGFVLMPLLLVHVRNELLYTGQRIPHFDVLVENIEKMKQETHSLVGAVVAILSKRDDALPLFARWTAWLMRQLLSHPEKDQNDVRSAAFVDNALIEAIGKKLKDQSISESPPDAPAWEYWCYRCVLASYAHSGFIAPPDTLAYSAEWEISSDEWRGDKGRRLLERASLFVRMQHGMPGMAAHLLAYPIVQAKCSAQVWAEMWNSAYALREIVEFGDIDAMQDSYHSKSEAGSLLLLLFSIGLAVLDQQAGQSVNNVLSETKLKVGLYRSLVLAAREMREIDDTLNRDKWRTAVQHLAIRRLIWEKPSSGNPTIGQPFVFCRDDTPTFSDYLKEVKSDAFELLALLTSASLNGSDIPSKLKNELREAAVNLSNTLSFVRRLNQYSPRRYPIDESQLREIERLNL